MSEGRTLLLPPVVVGAVFLATGHTGQTLPKGREVEEIDRRRRPPDGWRVIGSRESAQHER